MKTHQSILAHVAFDVEGLPQSRALDGHGHEVQATEGRDGEEPAIGVADGQLVRVVVRVQVEALGGAAVKAGAAAP